MGKVELQELFGRKISWEYTRFKQNMIQKEPEEVFAKAYQIDAYINIYELLLEMGQKIDEKGLEKLIIFPNLLPFLYENWLEKEDSYYRELSDFLKEEICKIPRKEEELKTA